LDGLTGKLGQSAAEGLPLIAVGGGKQLDAAGIALGLHRRLEESQTGVGDHGPLSAGGEDAHRGADGLPTAPSVDRYAEQVDDVDKS
jgi:hypothetical protein